MNLLSLIKLTKIKTTIKISIRILTDAINMIYINIDTVENVWSRKVLYLRIDKAPMKLKSAFKIESINIRRIKSNWAILSPIKINLERISRFY
jgi:hypothetical protein